MNSIADGLQLQFGMFRVSELLQAHVLDMSGGTLQDLGNVCKRGWCLLRVESSLSELSPVLEANSDSCHNVPTLDRGGSRRSSHCLVHSADERMENLDAHHGFQSSGECAILVLCSPFSG